MEEWRLGDKCYIKHDHPGTLFKPIIIECTVVKVGHPEFVRVDSEFQKGIKVKKKDLIRTL
jgi:hypothetical protein